MIITQTLPKRIPRSRAIISGDYKLVIDGDKNTGFELFDFEKTAESNNFR